MSRTKKVAILGAGASGLTAIKCCLDEDLEPVCFERTDEIGGLWNYTEKIKEGQACVMKSTVINTSKEMMSYSDFPIPKEYPIFMHNTFVWKYFNLYAEKFGLRKYIRFNTEVVHVKKRSDFDKTGQWDIQVKGQDGKTEDMVFDAVMLCTGHHAEKNMATFPGMDQFKGKIVHSHDYKDHRGFENKRVVIVGIGNSGGDAAVELSRVASRVFLSTRRGSWVIHRIVDNGQPLDMVSTTKFVWFLNSVVPSSVSRFVIESQLNKKFDHAAYSLKPDHSFFAQHPTVNDDLPNRIVSGTLVIKPNIKQFTSTGVEFDDGTAEDNIDVCILATGYVFGFPYLDESVIKVEKNEVNLYKYVFPPDLSQNTLAVIGCIQPLGAIMPISEQQSRLFLRVLKGQVSLPTKNEMLGDIRSKAALMAHRYVKSQRHTIQVDYITYMDELSELNGNKPNLGKLMIRDPRLAMTCFFGPTSPYQYRIEGPGKWSGARDAILTQWDRTYQSLKTRPLGNAENSSGKMLFLMLTAIVLIIALVVNVFYNIF